MSMFCRDLGPCTLTLGTTELPNVFEAAVYKAELTTAEVKDSINGETPVDIVTTGRKVSLEVGFAGANITALNTLLHGGTLVSVTNGLKLANSVGYAMGASKQKLIVKPYADGVASADEKEWVTINNAVFVENIEMSFGNKDQRTVSGTFYGLADATAANPITVFGDDGAT